MPFQSACLQKSSKTMNDFVPEAKEDRLFHGHEKNRGIITLPVSMKGTIKK
jgi:hypothetical protein